MHQDEALVGNNINKSLSESDEVRKFNSFSAKVDASKEENSQ